MFMKASDTAATKAHAPLGPETSSPMIDVQDLNVIYPGGNHVLRHVGFSLGAGSICAVLGTNGCGKSTLCNSLMGFQNITQGRIRLMGHSIRDAQRRHLVAYVPQSEMIDWDFPVSVYDVVMMGRQGQMNLLRRPMIRDEVLVRESLDRVDMLPYLNRQIGALSGGQKKRVFLARALAQKARLMVLDEPFTGVDVTTEKVILRILDEERQQGVGSLVVTHNLTLVPEYTDHVLMLNRNVIAFGKTEYTFTPDNLMATFGGMMAPLLNLFGMTSRDVTARESEEQPDLFTDTSPRYTSHHVANTEYVKAKGISTENAAFVNEQHAKGSDYA
ncbi:Vitamin B12 import ATP-binding protein BtuD [Halomonadaceae bacterium LMG 33818]|uniref:metal ABC transporter ATP-binding protein n=1 Tax=Cernens ardua TaxID=3402176 RepID=UPI003EDC053F